MKKGRIDKTTEFGADSERCASQLYLMLRNPDGYRRPDLISINGRYSPRLSIEVKSGRGNTGVMNASQLHYAITTEEDYQDILGEELPQRQTGDLLPSVNWDETMPVLPKQRVAYYYCLINRADSVTSNDLDRPWATIRLRWGNQFIVPHDYGFYAFAVRRAIRTGKDLGKVIDDLRADMRAEVLDQASHYQEHYYDPQGRQELSGRDILAFWHNDPSKTTQQGRERIKMIAGVYPAVKDLQRILIPGPNGTNIYILAEPDHEDLLNGQLRQTVEERTPVIERVTRARRHAERFLGKMSKVPHRSLFSTDGMPEQYSYTGLSTVEIRLLQRLSHWLDEGETELTAVDDSEYHASPEEAEITAEVQAEEGDDPFPFGANALTAQAAVN